MKIYNWQCLNLFRMKTLAHCDPLRHIADRRGLAVARRRGTARAVCDRVRASRGLGACGGGHWYSTMQITDEAHRFRTIPNIDDTGLRALSRPDTGSHTHAEVRTYISRPGSAHSPR